MSGKTNLTQKELDQLKVIADFLFFDEYQNKASYPQFEKTFGMFFKEAEIYLENVFKELCGPKKKYLTFPRLIRAYLDYKNNKSKLSSDTRKFFAMLFNRILKTEDDIILKGKKTKYKFYTSAGHKKRSYISKITVITDPNDMIEGMKIQYDDHMDVPLYDESQDVFFDSELEIGVIKTEDQEGEDLTSQANNITEYVVRDSITHIFGTYTDKIELLGFKTRAGKTYFAGKPIGEGFIYGNPMRQFHYVKFKVGEKNDGMYNLQPYFTSTPRTNEFLKLGLNDIKPALWENEELINEEKQIEKLTDEDLIDKYVLSAPIVSDDSGAGQEVKEANTTNDMEDLLAKDQKLYTMKDKDTTQEEEEASQLTLNDLISGGGQQVLRSRKPGQKSAPKAKATEEEGEKKTKKKIKAKQLGKERQVEENIFKDKKSYTQLVNRLSKDIEADLEKEKDKLRAAKETKNKAALEKKEAKEEKKKNKSQSKPKTQSKAKEEKPKEESKKKKKTKKKVASQGLGEEGPVLSQNYFRSKPKKETKPSTSSKKKPKIKTMASKKNIETNTFDTPEEFFDSVANSKSTNDIDDILNMDNDELKKMFYSKVVPTEEKPKKVKSKKNKSKTTDDLKKEEKKEKPIESKKSKSLSKTKGKGDPKADKRAQTNWKKFVEDMQNKKGLKILQNIGAVINAIGILSQEEKTKEKLPLAEKIRLLELLEENQNVIDFLYKGKKDTASKKKAEEVVIEDEDADITGLTDLNKLSIDEIAARINRMDELIREAKTEKEAKKLNKIKDKYVKRKNKILKEEEEKAKNEMVKKEKIKDTEIKKGEEEKRKKAVEEKNDYLNTILKETEKKNILIENAEKMAEKDAQEEEEKKIASLRANKGYASTKQKVSQTDKKKYVSAKTDPKHSFRNQKMPKTKDPFEDTIFEPIEDNLCESEGDEWLLPPGGIPEDVEGWEDYTWARIEEVFRHKNYKIFDIDEDGGGQIEDDDIIQGQIGDCYFLSAVASLSNRPDYI
ncbi:MAG: C2 family cysteine protease, partial [archaeon]|nr:C2 family cysteine protease [archaeon]